MNRLDLQVGDRVLLFGAGAMGQQLVQSLKMAGASELVVVDIDQKRNSIWHCSGGSYERRTKSRARKTPE